MNISTIRRTVVGVVLAAVSVTGVATAAGAAATPADTAPATAVASTLGPPGSTITYTQVLNRANDWYQRAPRYSQSTYIWDWGQTRKYRTDCSGFVDMALHLASDPTTFDYPNRPDDFHLIAHTSLHPARYFTPANVHTGDLFVDNQDGGHVWMFAYWGDDKTHFAYYDFGGGASGTAPPALVHGAWFGDSYLGGNPASHYTQYRYARITAG